MADALPCERDRGNTPLCSSPKDGTVRVSGRKRGKAELPRELTSQASRELFPATNPTPRHVLSARMQSGQACLSPQKAHKNNCLLLAPGSGLSETALGFFISTPCENTGNPASPILKYLSQEGRHIVFPGPLFRLGTCSIARFASAWQKQTNSDLPWKWHVLKDNVQIH